MVKKYLFGNNLKENTFKMSESNQPFTIHEGNFLLQLNNETISLTGEVSYRWVPNQGVYFNGETNSFSQVLESFLDGNIESRPQLYISEELLCAVIITNINSQKEKNKVTVSGINTGRTGFGNPKLLVDKITFMIPNFKTIYEGLIRTVHEEQRFINSGRLILETDNYFITIDQNRQAQDEKRKLSMLGGYYCSHYGEIIHKYERITLESVRDILDCLGKFLSFMNGRRTAPILLQGFKDEAIIFTDYNSPVVDPYKTTSSWMPMQLPKEFNQNWKQFYSLWSESQDNKYFITTSIHWYLEANKNSGFQQGELILACAGLELIFNWWLVDKKGEKFPEKIPLKGKIKEVLCSINFPIDIPSHLEHLKALQETTSAISNGPDAIGYIRNALVHARKENREKLKYVSPLAQHQALKLALLYIEVALLSLINYKGKYADRTSPNLWRGDNEYSLP